MKRKHFIEVSKIWPTIILRVINISFEGGHVPDSLKIATRNPVHKGGPKQDPFNYRPISILPVLSKFIQKHIAKHLFTFHNFLIKSQSGFRNIAFISLVDKWLKRIDDGDIVGTIFFI